MDISRYTVAELRSMLDSADETKETALIRRMRKDPRETVRSLAHSYMSRRERREALLRKFTEMIRKERAAWDQGYRAVAGIDEVGRGPLAGPVVAACVVWPPDTCLLGVDDSKKLTPEKREELFPLIMERAIAVGIGRVDNETIDKINILEATKLAMVKAIENCTPRPDYLLIDAVKLPVDMPCRSIVKGDQLSFAIAAASIVAKVTRDSEMVKLAETYPMYEWEHNKGYASAAHIEAIRAFGPCPLHRRSFIESIWAEDAG